MNASRKMSLLSLSLFCLIMTSRGNAATQAITLSSPDECEKKFMRWDVTEPKHEVQFFRGKRRDLNPKYQHGQAGNTLYRFDRSKLEVAPVLSEAQQAQLIKPGEEMGPLAVDDQGRQLALLVLRKKVGGEIIKDIAVLDASSGELRYRLSDGQDNHATAFSPGGRYLACYSTEPGMAMKPDVPIKNSAGRVIDLQTGNVRTLTEPFLATADAVFTEPPLWLDGERVLFRTFCMDRTLIDEQVKGFTGNLCPCAAVAYPASGKVRRLLFAHGNSPPVVFKDAKRGRIVLSDQQRVIVQTDYDLENKKVILEVDAASRLGVQGIRDDGTVRYEVGKIKQDRIPDSLFGK